MKIDKIRFILNTLFLIGVVVTMLLYFIIDNREPFFYAGFITLSLKVIEFILRFVY